MEGDAHKIEQLLRSGADVNSLNSKGCTALGFAAARGHMQTMQLLISRGASLDQLAADGTTALAVASTAGHVAIVDELLKLGACPNTRSIAGVTPLTAACGNGHSQVVQLLVDRGANVDSPGQAGGSPLLMAVQEGHLEIARRLIARKANPNLQSDHGLTALMQASRAGNEEAVRLLLENGADPNLADRNGDTAVDMGWRNPAVKELLMKRHKVELADQPFAASNPQTPSIRPIPATPPESARRVSCAACGEQNVLPNETPAFGTVISCPKCHVSLVPLSEGGYYTPEAAQMFLGYQHCSLESPGCPSCGKTNYSVVFPDNGHAFPWWANTTPRNPKGFAIDIKCVHCAKNFVVEWDDFPIKDKFCNYCSTLGIGIDFMSIPESRRKDFEWDYGRPPQLRSPIKTGKVEGLWLICPPCLMSAGQGRYRRLVSAAKAFAEGELARGRNLPPSVSLQQLVTGGYVEASRAVRFHGMEVTIPLKDDSTHPLGPCIRVQTQNGKASALLADGSIRDWSEYSRTVDLLAAAETGLEKVTGRSELDSLVVELIQIGRNIEDSKTGKSGFLRKRDSVEDMNHPRARELGRRLYDMGNRRIGLMQKANKMVEQALGAEAARELECCWHKIGMEDWQSGKGECWMM